MKKDVLLPVIRDKLNTVLKDLCAEAELLEATLVGIKKLESTRQTHKTNIMNLSIEIRKLEEELERYLK